MFDFACPINSPQPPKVYCVALKAPCYPVVRESAVTTKKRGGSSIDYTNFFPILANFFLTTTAPAHSQAPQFPIPVYIYTNEALPHTSSPAQKIKPHTRNPPRSKLQNTGTHTHTQSHQETQEQNNARNPKSRQSSVASPHRTSRLRKEEKRRQPSYTHNAESKSQLW